MCFLSTPDERRYSVSMPYGGISGIARHRSANGWGRRFSGGWGCPAGIRSATSNVRLNSAPPQNGSNRRWPDPPSTRKRAAMEYRMLGKSGLRVSELCFGAMTFAGDAGWRHVGSMGQREADACVGAALDGGINFFDTADIYSSGESERILGKALGPKRKDVILATKVGFRMGSGHGDDGC